MCGIIGIIGTKRSSYETYKGLFTLQHRGQDAAGILSYDFQEEKFRIVKNAGLVSEVFDEQSIHSLTGGMALGHTRYSTVGRGEKNDIQPMLLNYPQGIGMIHNGNLINYYELVKELRTQKRHSLTNNDLEVILNLFAGYLAKEAESEEISFGHIEKAVKKVYEKIEGGYAVAGTIADQGLFGFRDPNGIRPLVLGKKKVDSVSRLESDYAYILCSESNTLHYLGYELVRDVNPGELVFIDKKGNVHTSQITNSSRRNCMFEWVYFSSAESIIDELSVYEARIRLGEVLASKVQALIESNEISPDIVAPIPETSRLSAIRLGEKLQLKYREILIKNRYIHRSFILNTDEKRKNTVTMKLSPVRHEVEGRKILLVDDSIVRGTTSKKIVETLRECGAKEIYLASTCPQITHACYFGVDFPDPKKLVARDRSNEEIEKELGIDKVIYIDFEDLKSALRSSDLCMACLDGDYPVSIKAADEFTNQRTEDRYKPTNP